MLVPCLIKIYLLTLYNTRNADNSYYKSDQLSSWTIVKFTVHKQKYPERYCENPEQYCKNGVYYSTFIHHVTDPKDGHPETSQSP